MQPFEGFNFSDFWEQSDYATQEYVDDLPTAASIAATEATLGYKLPAAYIALIKSQNGGIPKSTSHKSETPTSWAEDRIAISGIFSIGSAKPSSLCGECGSEFWIEEWGYPNIGVYFADCPSAGHDMICLDYRACGPTGEPVVVYVDQEKEYKITVVAENFEDFIRGLYAETDSDAG